MKQSLDSWLERLRKGTAIPASPLALNARRKLDQRRQRALFRYYAAAGVGGIAVGVHTTQFAIRDPKIALFRPVLELAAKVSREGATERKGEGAKIARVNQNPLLIAGICGA